MSQSLQLKYGSNLVSVILIICLDSTKTWEHWSLPASVCHTGALLCCLCSFPTCSLVTQNPESISTGSIGICTELAACLRASFLCHCISSLSEGPALIPALTPFIYWHLVLFSMTCQRRVLSLGKKCRSSIDRPMFCIQQFHTSRLYCLNSVAQFPLFWNSFKALKTVSSATPLSVKKAELLLSAVIL